MDIGQIAAIENGDVLFIGDIIEDPEPGHLVLWEAHAFHRVWGGSNGGRGTLHHVTDEMLIKCPQMYRHLVRETVKKREAA